MARRRYGRRRRASSRKRGIPLGATIGVVIGLYGLYKTYTLNKTKSYGEIRNAFVENLTGYNIATKTWNITNAGITVPMIAGIGVSYAASKFHVNRYMPRGLRM